MVRIFRGSILAFAFFFLFFAERAAAQTPDTSTATLRELHADGMKAIAEENLLPLTGLQIGAQVSRKDLQAAADHLVQSGLFAKVSYEFRTKVEGLTVTYHVEEAPHIPAYFDNFPWFSDGELSDAIRKKLPFFNGTLPEAGDVIDQAGEALKDLLNSHGLQVGVEHLVLANPLGDGTVQEFQIQGAGLKIAKIEFSDPSLTSSLAVQQHLSELLAKPYSRMTIDLFLSEHVRPFFLQQGCLRAKLGPPEVRLTGNPNQKLPEQIPVYIPVAPGAVYHWKGLEWTGNSVLSTITLTSTVGMKPVDAANGVEIEAGWDRVREEYAHRGYLEAKVDPSAAYDDQAHTVSYTVQVSEGKQYKFGTMVLTGISTVAERRLREAWPIPPGESFDKAKYEEFLTSLETHPEKIFGDLPVHYENVGHWVRTDAGMGVADILLDFK
jgi:outer membrane protein assembly factor BamA